MSSKDNMPTLQFPADMSDEEITAAINKVVAGQFVSIPQQTLGVAPDPNSSQPPMTLSQKIGGIMDVAVSSMRGLVNQPSTTLAGLVGLPGYGGGALAGAFDPTMTMREGYQFAKDEARRQIEAGEGIVGSETITSPEGQRMAEHLGRLPVIRHLGQAFETIGEGVERVAGPEARDVTESAITLATMRAPKSFREPVKPTPSSVAVDAAKANGYRVSPMTSIGEGRFAGSKVDRGAAAIAGAEAVDSRIVLANQKVTDRLAARAGNLGDDLPSPANVERATQRANQAYDNLKGLNVQVNMSHDFFEGVKRLGEGVKGFPDKPNKQVRQLQNTLYKAQPTMANIVDKVRELRQNSFKNIASADPAANQLGHAQRQAANLLDSEIELYLLRRSQRAKDPGLQSQLMRLHSEYLKARQELSVLHDIRDAMNPATGSIDAAVLARLSKHHKLHPDLQKIADSYNTLGPNSMRNVARAARSAGQPFQVSSPALVVGALGGGAASQFLGASPMATAAGMTIAALAPSATRALAREFALRSERLRRLEAMTGKAQRGARRATAVGAQTGPIKEEDLDE